MSTPIEIAPFTGPAAERPIANARDGGTDASADRSGQSVTLPATVAYQLRELITEGEIAPGARLNERVLGERLGVSRTPLREAFRLLAAEGLIELQPNRGAVVVELSLDDVRESFDVMGGLEALSGELACRNVTDAEIAEIKALTFEMLACHARHDLPGYYRLNHAIHERINLAARNRLLTQVYRTLNLRIQNLRFRSNFDREKWNRAAQEHSQMVEALEARDAPRLSALLREHLNRKCDAVLDALRAEGAAPA
jgi:DNA-binding GntR family transcriptional regulator